MHKSVTGIGNYAHVRIALIGFMGSGKTTIGHALSARLNIPFIDLDSEIEQRSDRAISEIFKTSGESHFREVERQCLLDLLDTRDAFILACGGGTPCFFDNLEQLQTHAQTVYLQVGSRALERRLASERYHRPLLKNESKASLRRRIEKMMEQRRPFYARADIIVRPAHSEASAVARRIIERLRALPHTASE